MNEVTKLYDNVEPDRNCNLYKHFTECPMKHTQCEDCENFVYPPLTAEKQLNLIKWIAEYKEECRITYEKEYKWCTQTDWQSSFCYDNFPASLANLINNLWQDLTEAERKQIKEVLNG